MTQVITLPFRRALQERLVCAPWQSESEGISGPLGHELPHWDYNVDLRIVRTVTLYEREIRLDCGLSDKDRLLLAVLWRSSGTNLRGFASRIPLGCSKEPRELTLSATIPGHLMSGELHIATQVVLAAGISGRQPLVPRHAGTVLWEERSVVALEGTASRFPMEVIDFSGTHWAPYEAGWYLSWNSEDLEEPFLKNVRLFINGAHPRVVGSVQSPNPTPDQQCIRSVIYYDVGRQLLRGALNNEEFVEQPRRFGEGTTGRAIYGMLQALFPASSVKGMANTMRERPEYFESMLQGSLRLFIQ